MFDNKFLVTLIGLIVAVAAINIKTKDDDDIKEEFGMLPSFQAKVDVVAAQNSKSAAKGDFYSVPGTYQAMLSPRFSNTDYGANIRYNMPSRQNQANPVNPLTFSKLVGNNAQNYVGSENVRENFSNTNGGPANCGKGGVSQSYMGSAPIAPADYANGNYNEILNKAYSDSSFPASASSLPVSDMTQLSAGEKNGMPAPVVYDRFIYANRNSRLRSQGDPIRGDLAVVPAQGGWFRPSVQPNIDLQQGAMNVMGGTTNDTANSISNLIYTTSGNSQSVIGGVDLDKAQLNVAANVASGYNPVKSMQMNNQYAGGLSANQTDINVTSFP
jgi:Family of unknown function (DUF5850)